MAADLKMPLQKLTIFFENAISVLFIDEYLKIKKKFVWNSCTYEIFQK